MSNNIKYTFLALDLDGTLLDKNCQIPASTIKQLQSLISKSIKVTIATGRTFYSAHHFAGILRIDLPLVACNGALIKKALSGDILYRKALSNNSLNQLIKICQDYQLYYHGYSDEMIYLEKETDLTILDGDTRLAPCQVVNSLLELPSESILKLTILGNEAEIQKIYEVINNSVKVNIIRIKSTHLEILADSVTKGNALEFLTDRIGITKEQAIACGDGENDLEMLRWAGLGAAVANARQLVLEHADYVSPFERSKGVEDIINRFVLNALK